MTYGKILSALAIMTALCGCASPPSSPWDKVPDHPEVRQESIKLLGGSFKIRLWLAPAQKKYSERYFRDAFAELTRIARIVDDEASDSEISRVNANAFKASTPVSRELFEMLAASQSLHALTDGAFDITFVPIQEEVERFGADAGLTESIQEISTEVNRETRKRVGSKNLYLDHGKSSVRFMKAGVKIGIKGLAKGYAAQKAAEKLRSMKVKGYAVIGGGMFVAGGGALSDPGLMCVEDPSSLGSCRYRVIPAERNRLFAMAMANSQDRPGRIYNPKTAKRTTRSVPTTISGTEGMWVQATATAISIMGPDDTPKFLERIGKARVSAVQFQNPDLPEPHGDLSPHARMDPISERP